MQTMKFKTNAKCGGCVAAIGEKLNKVISPDNWNINLTSPNKELTVTADVTSDIIISAINDAGFSAEQLI